MTAVARGYSSSSRPVDIGAPIPVVLSQANVQEEIVPGAIENPSPRVVAARRYVKRHRSGVTLVAGAVAVAVAVAVTVMTTASASTQDTAPAGAIKAASFADQSGARVQNTMDVGGGQNVGWLANGDWMRYNGIDFGPSGTLTTLMRVAASRDDQNPRPGTVEVHLDAQNGPLVAAVPITDTGGWQKWITNTVTQASPGGQHDVYLVMHSSQGRDFVNINWFAFSVAGTPATGGPAAPASSAAPGPSTPSAGASSGTGWIDIDPAKWQAQVGAFEAMTPRPIPANARKNAEFNATCTYSHSAADDPIVFPGIAGASHMHTFIGNNTTNANTTTDDLLTLTASSCQPIEDHSAYWIPSLKENGTWVQPDQVVVYYGSLLQDKTKTMPMPQGLRMIAGNSKLQVPTPKGAVNQFYCAGGPQDGATRSTDGNWPVCAGGTLHFTLRFPDCWDGKHLDSPDHKSHVAFGVGGACTAQFPVPIPAVTFSIAYPTSGTANGFQLSSGMASSMHGDAFFAWENDAMAHRVKDCVVQETPCNTAGQF
jgi:hypothetical protein